MIVSRIRGSNDDNFGFNEDTEEYGDLVKAGVIDSANHSLDRPQGELFLPRINGYMTAVTESPKASARENISNGPVSADWIVQSVCGASSGVVGFLG